MPSFQIRDLPEDLYVELKRRAVREHRSLAQQAIVLLKEALGGSQADLDRRQKLVKQVKEHPVRLPKGAPSPTALIREDRLR